MSKLRLPEISRRNLVLGGVGLLGVLVVGFLIWKFAASGAVEAPAVSAVQEPYIVTGFRSAQFGADEDGVRAAIAKDFGLSGDTVKTGTSPVEKTRLLAVRVKDVLPESGDAEVVYILGHKSKALIQVNIIWGSQLTPNVTASTLGITATVLKQYFAKQAFVPDSVKSGVKLPNGALLVFSALDTQGHLVNLVFQEALLKPAEEAKSGEPAKPTAKGKGKAKDDAAATAETAATAPKKLVALRLSYIKDVRQPDIFKVEKGQF